MTRSPANAQDVALVVAAADFVARYASQNALTQMQIGTMIADVHAILVDRLNHGPRVAIDAPPQLAPTARVERSSAAGMSEKPIPFAPPPPSAKPAPDSRFDSSWIVAAPMAPPFLPIEASVAEDGIVCLECGKKFMTLKRHLSTVHHQTDIEYRRKYGLSGDYPMISEAFERDRRILMQSRGAFRPLTKAERELRHPKMPDDANE